jgi:hypothetical protein
MNTSDNELSHRFEGPGAAANGLTCTKNAYVKCLPLHFQLELNTLDVLNVSKRKKSKGLSSSECWCHATGVALPIHLTWGGFIEYTYLAYVG